MSRTTRTIVLGAIVTVLGTAASGLAEDPPQALSERGDSLQSTDKIVGGAPVTPGVWPDCAAVVFGTSADCTGVLVAPDVVLTAAHCIPGVTQVYLSTWDIEQTPGEVINVVSETAYPNWWSTYDIAILMLQTESSVAPRPIAHGCAEAWIQDGAPVAIVGWGATDIWGYEYPTVLMEGFTTITDADCSDLASGCNPSVSPNGELGAGGDGIDTCYGDSGGPLYLLTPFGEVLAGITSRAFSTATLPCSQGGIYTRPDAVIDWIEQQTGRTLPEPDCSSLIFADGFESGDLDAWTLVSPGASLE